VSEPTRSGVSDLERAMEMARKLKIPGGVLVNRADINEVLSRKIEAITMQTGNDFWGAIPLSSDFVRAVRNGKTVLEETDDERITSALTQTWRSILERFQKWQ
jgi:MinD superfamily P-loop ATPase